jgi:hypothetical protein
LPGEVVDLRRLRARDLRPLLEVEARSWLADLRWDFSVADRMITECLDEQRLTGYALLESGEPRGYVFFFYEDEKGLIGNLFIAPDREPVEGGRRLLTHAVETLLATPGLRRVEAQLPHFAPEDLAPQLLAGGFRMFPRHFMALELDDRWTAPPTASPILPAEKIARLESEFRFEPWARRHEVGSAVLVYNTYHQHVDAKLNDHYASTSGAAHLLENILHHRGCGDPVSAACWVAVHRASQKLAGLLILTRVRKGTAHIPQIAVGPEFQGAGLGTELMRRSFEALLGAGLREVSLTVTAENTGAVRLYERLGFRTFRDFGAFVWERS